MKLVFEVELKELTQSTINAGLDSIRAEMAKLVQEAQAPPATPEATLPEASVVQVLSVVDGTLPTKTDCLTAVFNDVKRTDKTEAILEALLDTTEGVEVKDLTEVTGIDTASLSNWFSVTGKKIKGIVKEGRGKYRFDRTQIKVS